jgi:hypothetical protein
MRLRTLLVGLFLSAVALFWLCFGVGMAGWGD